MKLFFQNPQSSIQTGIAADTGWFKIKWNKKWELFKRIAFLHLKQHEKDCVVYFLFYFESNREKRMLSMKKFVAIAAATLVSAVVVAAPSKKHEVVETTAATTTATTSSAPATTDTGILAPATASAASN